MQLIETSTTQLNIQMNIKNFNKEKYCSVCNNSIRATCIPTLAPPPVLPPPPPPPPYPPPVRPIMFAPNSLSLLLDSVEVTSVASK